MLAPIMILLVLNHRITLKAEVILPKNVPPIEVAVHSSAQIGHTIWSALAIGTSLPITNLRLAITRPKL